jgi:nitrite reductase/ring-hydroxylating ferredoxin subunit
MWWSTMTGKLERAQRLDPVVETISGATSKVLPPGPVKDALHGRWLAHPLHPLLITMPIGLWSSASLLDFVGGDGSQEAARRLVGAGVLAVAPTAAAGLADWSELGAAREPKRVGLVHATANGLSAALYAASWFARRGGNHRRGRTLALLGAASVTVGGYLGGHLSYSQGVGVNRNADADKQPADWTDAAAATDIPEDGLLGVEVAGQPIVLARSHGEVYAMLATCSHYGGPLDEGRLEDGCVVCPWHGSHFRLRDGGVERGPATAPQTAYDVRTVGDRVEVRARA